MPTPSYLYLNINGLGPKEVIYGGSRLESTLYGSDDRYNFNCERTLDFIYDESQDAFIVVGDLVHNVDSSLSDTSKNPVQNKVIKSELDKIRSEIPSGSSGSSSWELINTVTLEEDSNSIVIDKDSDGNPFELSALMFYINRVVSSSQTESSTLYVSNSASGYFGQMAGQTAAQTRLWFSAEFMTSHMWRQCSGNGASANFVSSVSYAGGAQTSAPMIRLYGYYFGAGTQITLYGVRK